MQSGIVNALLFLIILFPIVADARCSVSNNIKSMVVTSDISILYRYSDAKRNISKFKNLCTHLISFSEGKYRWKMLLVTNSNRPKGTFWFLPHDDENEAFDSAVYATNKYGGGFLAVLNKGKRYFLDQDPNRNFSDRSTKVSSCRHQKGASAIYTRIVFKIIDSFRGLNMPYLSLHNNTNGGGVSILKSSKSVRSFLAHPRDKIKNGIGLMDEDSLIYIAGKSSTPPMRKIDKLRQHGINVKYEIVNSLNNDCSMSNYVVLRKGSNDYYNIETQHGDSATQKKMIDILMGQIMR